MKRIQLAITVASLVLIPSAAFAGPLQNRLDRQDQRIYNGVQNGELTYQEYEKLSDRQENIEDFRQRQIQDGNGLNPVEAIRINRRLNKQSHKIYRGKHN